MSLEDSIQALTDLGFSAIEAEIYAFLVQESPATGYRVAQALCRPAANVYKAIEALEGKGAVLIDQGANRVCRAVPPDELLAQLDRAFQQRRKSATQALAELHGSQEDDRVYQLRSREQVLERCRQMLNRAQRLALVDAFPQPLEALRSDLETTSARGPQVVIKGYEPVEVTGAHVVMNPRGPDLMAQYPGQWIILLVDGAELLIASLDANGKDLHQAIWSGSTTLSWIFHCSFAAEIMLSALLHHIDEGASSEELRAAIAPWMHPDVEVSPHPSELAAAMQMFRSFYGRGMPGYESVVARFGKGSEGEPPPILRPEPTTAQKRKDETNS